jgi:hypothetical protein
MYVCMYIDGLVSVLNKISNKYNIYIYIYTYILMVRFSLKIRKTVDKTSRNI